jgi:DNA-binding SARP family transcriptional activator/streptogramin lyase
VLHQLRVEFRILGPLEVLDDRRELDLGGVNQRALLAVLLVNANRVVSNRRLIQEVWGEHPPETASAMVRNYVSRLRKELNGAAGIHTRPPGYVLHVDPGCVDLDLFQRLYDEGRQALTEPDPQRAVLVLRKALDLWRGPALADLAGTEIGMVEGARLEQLRRGALVARIEAELALGRDGDLIAELEGLVRDEPHDEAFRRQLMLALYRAGRQSDALAAYRDAHRQLSTDLGIEPGPELRELEASILRHDPSLAPELPRSRKARTVRRRLGRPSRTKTLAGVAVLGAVLAATLPVALSSRGSASTEIRARSVVAMDQTGRVVADAPLHAKPLGLTGGASGVWVSTSDQTVERVDPRSHRITRTIGLGLVPTDLAVLRGVLWITSQGYLHRVLRITASDGDVRSIPLSVSLPPVGRLGHVAPSGKGAVVVDGDHSLFRVGAIDAMRVGDVPSGYGGPSGDVAIGAGSIWVSDPHSSAVSRVDPRSGRIVASIPLGSPNESTGAAPIVVGEGSVWVALANERTLFQIHPDSNAVVRTYRLGPRPSSIAVGRRTVWVTDAAGAPLTRIDVVTGRVQAIELRRPAVGVVVVNGLVWIAVSG